MKKIIAHRLLVGTVIAFLAMAVGGLSANAQSFSLTGNLNMARLENTATLLNNGMVLIAGGVGSNSASLADAELYNPATGNFTLTGSLNTARAFHTATLLSNGQVLVAGGYTNDRDPTPVATSIERFDRIEDIAACIVRKKANVVSRD